MNILKTFLILIFCIGVCYSQSLKRFDFSKKSNSLHKSLQLNNLSLINQNSLQEKILFDSDNLHFYNSHDTWVSIGKISAEAAAGAIPGYGIAAIFYSKFKKVNGEEILVNGLFYLALAAIGAVYGTNLGVYTMGNIFGDEGNFWYSSFCSLIGGSVFYLFSGIFTKNPESRLWISLAGLPIGSVFGFNTEPPFKNIIPGWMN